MSDLTKNLRKKLLYRSKNRGCRETDILLGEFAAAQIDTLPAAELPLYERFLDEYDGDIYKWLTKQAEMPEEYKNGIGQRVLKFASLRGSATGAAIQPGGMDCRSPDGRPQ